jgi:hypothetical protein
MDLAKLFIEATQHNTRFKEAVKVVKDNSQGKVWLVGGFLYRTIAHGNGSPGMQDVDFDFIVERPKDNISLPPGWSLTQNKYGNPKFVKGSINIDFVPLSTVQSIVSRRLAPDIQNYLSGVPLTVQAIAFDISEGKMLGDVGVKALLERSVAVNNTEQALKVAEKRGVSVEELVRSKAQSLGFKSITS